MRKYCSRVLLFLIITLLYTNAPNEMHPAFAQIGEALDNAKIGEVIENPTPGTTQANDPMEKTNRKVFDLNDKIYFWAMKPIAKTYSAYLPEGFRVAVKNASENFVFPARFVNCMLQHKGEKADIEFKRFFINSTLGIGGMFDVARDHYGMSAPGKEDFGQTLAVWGIQPGPFLMLPVLGPSNPRDLIGYAADSTMDPLFWIPTATWVSPTVKAGKLVNSVSLKLGKYEEFKQSAIDPYVSMREGYIQHRESEIQQ